MRDRVYLYSSDYYKNFIKDLLVDFEVLNLTEDLLKDTNFKNNNVLFLNEGQKKLHIKDFFYSNNAVIVFISKKENKIGKKNKDQTKIVFGPLKVEKFNETLKAYFFPKNIIFEDIKILGEKMINIKNSLSCNLTMLEKKILLEFVKQKKIKREYFLEKIFEVKKNIETKTIESHLTRIRKKILLIKSKIIIFSKDDVFALGVNSNKDL